MVIHRYVISALGRCVDHRDHDSAKFRRSAVAYFTELLERNFSPFRVKAPLKGVGELVLHWSSENLSCGMATLYAGGELLASDVMVSGIKADADAEALRGAQATLESMCAAVGEASSDGLLRVNQRPAVASIHWTTPERGTLDKISDLELCLAAAFLERAFRAGAMVL